MTTLRVPARPSRGALTSFLALAAILALAAPAAAKPLERRLHSDALEASSFLWNDWNKFVENYHPNYAADDDPATAWVEGAKGSGAGEWLRVQVTPLDKTTRVRLRVRNGYQKSKALWQANARAKAVTVRLLPSKAERQVTLADAEGWQEIVVDQASGPVRAVELLVRSVYDGARYPDLCISDVQVLATSETPDNPAFEKSKLASLMAWRGARLAAAKAFSGKQLDLPIYPAYSTTRLELPDYEWDAPTRAAMIALAQKEPGIAKEWKDAIAVAAALEANLAIMTRVQLAPVSAAKLVAVDGIQIPEVSDIHTGEGPYLDSGALRLPMVGIAAALFADRLRALDVTDKQTIEQFLASKGRCGPDVAWVARTASKEAAARVSAIAIGRCERVVGRAGSYLARTVELLVYDASGRLALVVGDGHVDAYRWAMDGGKPMLAGGRAVLWGGGIVEAKRREAVAAQ